MILLLPSGAGAKGFEYVDLEARGKADGHAFKITAFGFGNDAFVFAEIRPDSPAEPGKPRIDTFYFPLRRHATSVTSKRLRMKLGQRGKSNLRFKPEHTHVRSLGACGPSLVRSRGTLVGRLRFRGERGYVHIDERRIKARQTTIEDRRRDGPCARRPAPDRPPPVLLGACTGDGRAFGARTFESGRTNYVLFGDMRQERGLGKFSLGRVVGAPGEFEFAPDLSSATITPPAPFGGTGYFADGLLQGDLRFNLPASGRVRLTPASALLVRAERIRCGDYRLPDLPRFSRAGINGARQVLAHEIPWFRPFG